MESELVLLCSITANSLSSTSDQTLFKLDMKHFTIKFKKHNKAEEPGFYFEVTGVLLNLWVSS